MSLLPAQHRTRPPLEQRRAERQLFFWTANRVLWLVLLTAIVVFVIVQMFHGRSPIEVLKHLGSWAVPFGGG